MPVVTPFSSNVRLGDNTDRSQFCRELQCLTLTMEHCRSSKEGKWHGFEWLQNEDEKSVHDNKQVTKREYLRACANPNLPPFRESDNRPLRKFPPEVLAAMNRTRE